MTIALRANVILLTLLPALPRRREREHVPEAEEVRGRGKFELVQERPKGGRLPTAQGATTGQEGAEWGHGGAKWGQDGQGERG